MLDAIKSYLRQYGFVGQLAGAMILVYLIQAIIAILIRIISNSPDTAAATTNEIFRYFDFPTGTSLFWTRPWTIITYPFEYYSSKSVLRMVFDILILFSFGQIFWSILGQERLKRFMVFAVISVALVSWLIYCIPMLKATNVESYFMSGMSAPICVLIAACVVFMPTYEIFLFGIIRMQLVWLGLILLLIYLTNVGDFPARSEALACLTGLGIGAGYAYLLKNHFDITEVIWTRAEKIWNKIRSKEPEAPFIKVKYKADASKNTISQAEIDRILDKISDKGYQSLTQEEKETLEKASKAD